MQNPQFHKTIYSKIVAVLGSVPVSDKLTLLEDYYQNEKLDYSEEISDAARLLTKRLFGTGLKAVQDSLRGSYKIFGCLKAFAFILLKICFQEEHVLDLLLSQIQQGQQLWLKLSSNPFEQLGIQLSEVRSITAELVRKIGEWQKVFQIAQILDSYYISVQILALLLHCILIKLKHPQALNQEILSPNAEIFTILSEYFDISLISKTGQNLSAHQKNSSEVQVVSQIYLFNDFNYFIVTHDDVEFCVGRYYQNHEDLLRGEKTVRKSIMEYIMKLKDPQQKTQNSQLKPQNEKTDSQMKFSGIQFDLGVNASGFLSPQQDTPYFQSNAPTPEFGNLMDRIKKSFGSEELSENISKTKNKQQKGRDSEKQQIFPKSPPSSSKIKTENSEEHSQSQIRIDIQDNLKNLEVKTRIGGEKKFLKADQRQEPNSHKEMFGKLRKSKNDRKYSQNYPKIEQTNRFDKVYTSNYFNPGFRVKEEQPGEGYIHGQSCRIHSESESESRQISMGMASNIISINMPGKGPEQSSMSKVSSQSQFKKDKIKQHLGRIQKYHRKMPKMNSIYQGNSVKDQGIKNKIKESHYSYAQSVGISQISQVNEIQKGNRDSLQIKTQKNQIQRFESRNLGGKTPPNQTLQYSKSYERVPEVRQERKIPEFLEKNHLNNIKLQPQRSKEDLNQIKFVEYPKVPYSEIKKNVNPQQISYSERGMEQHYGGNNHLGSNHFSSSRAFGSSNIGPPLHYSMPSSPQHYQLSQQSNLNQKYPIQWRSPQQNHRRIEPGSISNEFRTQTIKNHVQMHQPISQYHQPHSHPTPNQASFDSRNWMPRHQS